MFEAISAVFERGRRFGAAGAYRRDDNRGAKTPEGESGMAAHDGLRQIFSVPYYILPVGTNNFTGTDILAFASSF